MSEKGSPGPVAVIELMDNNEKRDFILYLAVSASLLSPVPKVLFSHLYVKEAGPGGVLIFLV